MDDQDSMNSSCNCGTPTTMDDQDSMNSSCNSDTPTTMDDQDSMNSSCNCGTPTTMDDQDSMNSSCNCGTPTTMDDQDSMNSSCNCGTPTTMDDQDSMNSSCNSGTPTTMDDCDRMLVYYDDAAGLSGTNENGSYDLNKVDARQEDITLIHHHDHVKQEISTTEYETQTEDHVNTLKHYRTCRINSVPNYTGHYHGCQNITVENVVPAQKTNSDSVKHRHIMKKKTVMPIVVKKINNNSYKVCLNEQVTKHVHGEKPEHEKPVRRRRRKSKVPVENVVIKTEVSDGFTGMETKCSNDGVIDNDIKALVYGADNCEATHLACETKLSDSNSQTTKQVKHTRRKSRPVPVQGWRNLPRAKRKPPTPEVLKARELKRTCQYCGVVLPTPTHRTIHERVHTGDKPYMCGMCRKSYKSSSDLGVHIRRVHTVGNTVPCGVCESKFSTKASLNIHMRIHTGHRPYSCGVCGKEFYQSGHLVYHTRIHTGDRPHPCTICGQSFAQKPHLDRHLRAHSGIRPYTCDICYKTFSQLGHLYVHRNIHTGDRPLSCPLCPRSFALRQNLRVHLRTHSDERPYECEYCFKTFKQNSYLSKHIQLHKDGKLLPHI